MVSQRRPKNTWKALVRRERNHAKHVVNGKEVRMEINIENSNVNIFYTTYSNTTEYTSILPKTDGKFYENLLKFLELSLQLLSCGQDSPDLSFPNCESIGCLLTNKMQFQLQKI